MAAYRRVYDSCHLQVDYKNQDQLRVWATFTLLLAEKCFQVNATFKTPAACTVHLC